MSFAVVDPEKDPLPAGDVATIRQILQHVSNARIKEALPKLRAYKHLIVTEKLPLGAFTPSRDKKEGMNIRLDTNNSGNDLALSRFDLRCTRSEVICSAIYKGSTIRTTVYKDPSVKLRELVVASMTSRLQCQSVGPESDCACGLR